MEKLIQPNLEVAVDATRVVRRRVLGGVQQVFWDAVEAGTFDTAIYFDAKSGRWEKITIPELLTLRQDLYKRRSSIRTILGRLLYAVNRPFPFILPVAESVMNFISSTHKKDPDQDLTPLCSVHQLCPSEMRVAVLDIPVIPQDLKALGSIDFGRNCLAKVSRVAYVHDLMPIFAPKMIDAKNSYPVTKSFMDYLDTALGFEKLVTNSIFTKNELIEFGKLQKRALPETEVAYPPMSPLGFTPELGPTNQSSGKIFAIGPWTPRKRFFLLFEAAQILADEGLDIRVEVVRGHSAIVCERTLKAFAELRKAFPDRVVVRGFISPQSLNDAFIRSDVVAIPSAYEGFGLPALQAARLGKRVVCSRNTALIEVGNLIGAEFPKEEKPSEWATSLRTALGAKGHVQVDVEMLNSRFTDAIRC